MDDLVTILPIPGSGFSSGIDFSSLYYHIVSIFGCPLQCDNKCQTCFGEDDDKCLCCVRPSTFKIILEFRAAPLATMRISLIVCLAVMDAQNVTSMNALHAKPVTIIWMGIV